MRWTAFIFTLCFLTLSYGCAPPPTPTSTNSNTNYIRPLQQQVHAQQQQLQTLDNALQQLTSTVVATQTELTAVRAELAALHQQQTTTQTLPAAIVTTAPQQPESSGPSATEIYRNAFAAYTQGNYDEAVHGFGQFVNEYPQNPFAPTAYFRQGEALLAQGKNQQALESFAAIVLNYPDAHKAPQALLKMATLFKKITNPNRHKRLWTGYNKITRKVMQPRKRYRL